MDWNVFSAMVSFVMLGMVGWGYYPIFKMSLSLWVMWVSSGMLILVLVMAARSMYWDIGQFVVGDHWLDLRAFLGGQNVSTIFNVGVMVACWVLLKARLFLIPHQEQKNYRWWNAWLHPCERCRFRWRKSDKEE